MDVTVGERVTHPTYGSGQVVQVFKNGGEWLVRFENGLRFRRPRQEFARQALEYAPAPPPSYALPGPMPRTQFEARQLVEALRVGVAPAQHVRALTIGLTKERESVAAALREARSAGGAVRAVVGEYGFGKSHLVELCAQEALERNFLVATASLDLQELPPHRAFAIYSALTRSLRYPDSDERGLGPLFERADAAGLSGPLQSLTEQPVNPLTLTLDALAKTPGTRARTIWLAWLMGARRVKVMNKATPTGVKFPSVYKVGHNARQMAFLLSGLSSLAKLSGYSGLCVLIDEAESYSLLHPDQRPKAGLFFSASVHAALRERSLIPEDSLPQHRFKDYPAAYSADPRKQALLFLFTVTRSDNRLPLEDWLTSEQVLELDPHYSPQEVGQFLSVLQNHHAQAYSYQPGERQGQIRRAAAEHLGGAQRGVLSPRSVVRLATELFDLLYLKPELEVATLLEELRQQLRA